MTLQIGDIEKRFQSLIEVYLVKFLPAPAYLDRIVQRFSETLRSQAALLRSGGETSLPGEFALIVHPTTLTQWNQDERLLEGLTRILRLVIDELGMKAETVPSLTIVTDPNIAIEDLQLRPLKPVSVAETQDMQEKDAADEGTPLRLAFLIVGGTKVYTIQAAVTNIGRRSDNHLIVDDPRISRYHAQVRYVRGRFIIFDLNSTGGTYVNGQRVNQSVLYPGDVISLSGLPIIFGQDSPPPGMSKGDTAPLNLDSGDRSTAVLKSIPPSSKPEN
jgi:hypothetical protein